jgi:hypothetical protein
MLELFSFNQPSLLGNVPLLSVASPSLLVRGTCFITILKTFLIAKKVYVCNWYFKGKLPKNINENTQQIKSPSQEKQIRRMSKRAVHRKSTVT